MTEARITKAGGQAVIKNEAKARTTVAGALVPFKGQEAAARVSALAANVVFRPKAPRVPKGPVFMNAIYSEDRGIVGDQVYDKVELLLTADHKGIRDLSRKRRGLLTSISGGPGLESGLARFGTHCMRFAWLYRGSLEAAVPYIRADNSDGAFLFGSQPFTVEVWVRVDNSSPNSKPVVGVWSDDSTNKSWLLKLQSGSVQFLMSPDGTTVDTIQGTIVEFNEWNHIAVDRDKTGKVRLYLNGQMVASEQVNYSLNQAVNRDLTVGYIGGFDPESSIATDQSLGSFVGYMDDLRITRGWARYESDTTYQVPDQSFPFEPFEVPDYFDDGDPYYNNVVLLLDPLANANVQDFSPNPAPVSGNMSTTTLTLCGISDARVFADNGTVVSFAGNGERFNLNGPVTIEVVCMYQDTAITGYNILQVPNHFRVRVARNTTWVQAYKNGAWMTLYGGSSDWGYWRHFIVTRDEQNTTRIYYNGRFVAKYENDVWDDPGTDAPLMLTPDAYIYSGVRIGPARITKGVARWTHETPYGDVELYRIPLKTQAVIPTPPEPTYPYQLPVINPGAENASNRMWSVVTGTRPDIVSSPTPHDGDYAYDSGQARFNWYFQHIEIPKAYWADIDAGLVQLIANAWATGTLTGDDRGGLNVIALDEGNNILHHRLVLAEDVDDWTEISHDFRLPKGARAIRIGVRSYRDPENEALQLYWDDFSLTLEKETEPLDSIELLRLGRLGVGPWRPALGGDLVEVVSRYGLMSVGVHAGLAAYFVDIPIPDELWEDIDDEETPLTAVVDYHLVGQLNMTGAVGRFFIDARDEHYDPIGRIYDAEEPYSVDAFGEDRTLEVKLPAGTRSLSVGIIAEQNDLEFLAGHPVTYIAARIERRGSSNMLGPVDIPMYPLYDYLKIEFANYNVHPLITDGANPGGVIVADDADSEIGTTVSLRMPPITHNQTAYIDLPIWSYPGFDTVTIRYRTDSENNWDWFQVFVDGVQQMQASGQQTDYREFSVQVPYGQHTLRLQYSKDGSTSTGTDTVYFSRIVIPVRNENTTVRLMEDGTIRRLENDKPRYLEN